MRSHSSCREYAHALVRSEGWYYRAGEGILYIKVSERRKLHKDSRKFRMADNSQNYNVRYRPRLQIVRYPREITGREDKVNDGPNMKVVQTLTNFQVIVQKTVVQGRWKYRCSAPSAKVEASTVANKAFLDNIREVVKVRKVVGSIVVPLHLLRWRPPPSQTRPS